MPTQRKGRKSPSSRPLGVPAMDNKPRYQTPDVQQVRQLPTPKATPVGEARELTAMELEEMTREALKGWGGEDEGLIPEWSEEKEDSDSEGAEDRDEDHTTSGP